MRRLGICPLDSGLTAIGRATAACVVLTIASFLPQVGASTLDACLGTAATAASDDAATRLSCVRSQLKRVEPFEQLNLLSPFLDSDPDTVAAYLAGSRMTSKAEPALKAHRLDLLGQAYSKLERWPEAAEALSEAVALDNGTLRVQWYSPAARDIEAHEIAPGNGRLERAARALRAAGKEEAARSMLARSLVLGAGEAANAAWSDLGGAAIPGLDAKPSSLAGIPWREPLPDLSVQLFGGKKSRLRDFDGKVLLLDFWASWCVPCVRELPFIESLYQSRNERGLEVLAINYHEQPQEALAFAQSMGLTIPVGLADKEIESALEIKSMPTVIVADRAGRIRGRWAGYEDHVEEELTALLDTLLDTHEVPKTEVGTVLLGDDALEVEWVRVARRDVAGLGVIEGDTGPRIAVALAKSLMLFDIEGVEDRRLVRPPAASQLRPADLNGDGIDEVIGFRPGNKTILIFDVVAKTYTHWEAPQPVFDVAGVLQGEAETATLLIGTLDGLWRADPSGAEISEIGELGTISDIAVSAKPGEPHAVLESGVRLHWLDDSLELNDGGAVTGDSWTLVRGTEGTGVGVASEHVTAAAAGRFLRDASPLLAYGSSSGQLVLVDAKTGATRYRAAFPGPVTGLAGGDLDGDGIDELLVLQGRNLVLLRVPAPATGSMKASR